MTFSWPDSTHKEIRLWEKVCAVINTQIWIILTKYPLFLPLFDQWNQQSTHLRWHRSLHQWTIWIQKLSTAIDIIFHQTWYSNWWNFSLITNTSAFGPLQTKLLMHYDVMHNEVWIYLDITMTKNVMKAQLWSFE